MQFNLLQTIWWRFVGITDKIKSGYFKDLGINTLWLSPITKNPKDAWGLWNKGGKRVNFRVIMAIGLFLPLKLMSVMALIWNL